MTVASAVVSVKGGVKFFKGNAKREEERSQRKEDGEVDIEMNERRSMRCR